MSVLEHGMDDAARGEDDEDPEDVMDDVQEDLFHFIPSDLEDNINANLGVAGPGPSTAAQRSLDDDEDTRTEEEYTSAGKVIRMNSTLHELWRRRFQDLGEGDSDVEMGDAEGNPEQVLYHPFASELDWRIANWMIKDNPGHNAFDRLLLIPGVSTVATPYSNANNDEWIG